MQKVGTVVLKYRESATLEFPAYTKFVLNPVFTFGVDDPDVELVYLYDISKQLGQYNSQRETYNFIWVYVHDTEITVPEGYFLIGRTDPSHLLFAKRVPKQWQIYDDRSTSH